MQDRDVTRGQLEGWRFFNAAEARPTRSLWGCEGRGHNSLYSRAFSKVKGIGDCGMRVRERTQRDGWATLQHLRL